HRYGPQSDEVRNAVLEIDKAIGRLIDGLKNQGIFEHTLITFNSDHGMSAFERKQVSIEPTKALKDAGFQVAISQNQLNDETQIIVLEAGVRLIYFRKMMAVAQKERVLKILSGIQGAEVLDRKKLDALGCHDNRSGDLIVSPLPGYTMSHAGRNGGQHGRLTEQNPVPSFCGPGFNRGEPIHQADTVDVAPS